MKHQLLPSLKLEGITRQTYRPDVYDIDTNKLFEYYRKIALEMELDKKKTKLIGAYLKNNKWKIKAQMVTYRPAS